MKNTYDNIVIGGGIVGSAIAYELAKNGLNVLCISDSDGDFTSASFASGAMLGAFAEITHNKQKTADRIETEFRIKCAKSYDDYLAEISDKSDLSITSTKGTFIISNNAGKDDLVNLNFIQEQAEYYSEPYEIVELKDVPSYNPHRMFRPSKIIYLPNEASLNSNKLVISIRKAAINTGKVDWLNGKVEKIDTKSGRASGVKLLTGELITSPNIIIAAGYGSRLLVDEIGNENLNLPVIKGGKGSSLLVSTNIKFPNVIRTPNRDFACGTHVLQRDSDNIYIGATNRISDTPGEKAGVTLGELHVQLHSALHEINTELRTENITKFNVGARPLTTDGYPLIGRTKINGLYIATGTYRNGVLMAPMIGKLIVDDILYNSSISNPFLPELREKLLTDSKDDIKLIVKNGVRDLVSFIQEPHGLLPYKRTVELESFIEKLILGLTVESDVNNKLKKHVNDFLKNPQLEAIPSLYYSLASDDKE
ncbi:FAD-binding oxidoreductase [Acinetobacter baumannii]